MDFQELKQRAKCAWQTQYREALDCIDTLAGSVVTGRAYSKLLTIEETISELTGNMISESDFDQWRDEVRKERGE